MQTFQLGVHLRGQLTGTGFVLMRTFDQFV
jgi:hypothetical protein